MFGLPPLIDFFSGYASYHNNTVNKMIHLVCIPIIVLSLISILEHYTFRWDFFNNTICEFQVMWVLTFLLGIAYISIDFVSGVFSFLIYNSFNLIANHYYYEYVRANDLDTHWKISLAIHCGAWILQFIGHGFFEKRKPALLDNIFQTLVAPDFVVLEVMFWFGYRSDSYKQIKQNIQRNIEEFKRSYITQKDE